MSALRWTLTTASSIGRRRVVDSAGFGRIFRANIQVPQGQSAENRRDIELLYDNLPEPIDLDLDPVNRTLYWTDRGDPPRGNTVNRAPMDPEAQDDKEPEILFTHLMEGIGLALDLKGGRMFITDFGGSVYSANLDGSNRRTLLDAEGNLTGIAYAEVPPISSDTVELDTADHIERPSLCKPGSRESPS